MKIKYLVGTLNVPNLNNRIYDVEIFKAALETPIIKEKIRNKVFFGEAGFPTDISIERQSMIDVKNISHIITNAYVLKNKAYLNIEILDTERGNKLKNAILKGLPVHFGMRATCDIIHDSRTNSARVTNLEIVTFDWTDNSSFKDAKILKIKE